MSEPAKPWKVVASKAAKRTINPLRAIVDKLQVKPNPDKELIRLSIGDPTVYEGFETDSTVVEAVCDTVKSGKYNGYSHSAGFPHAREQLARFWSHPDAPLTSDDVIFASGCSGAIEMAITALANEGQNILMPSPGFSLYFTIANHRGIECRYYKLDPEKSFEADLEHLQSLIDGKTAAIIINNPSNPCGTVYSREHLVEFLAVAEKHRLPVISDEVYAYMTWDDSNPYIPLARLTKTVPILTVGGIAKRYLVPGWRFGWLLIHDRNGVFAEEVKPALFSLAQLILGPNTLIQSIVPTMLSQTPERFYAETNRKLAERAKYTVERASRIDGLSIVTPKGAMYAFIKLQLERFEDIPDDLVFTQRLLQEEAVFVLPGQVFFAPGFFRVVICASLPTLKEAFDRIEVFCKRHLKNCPTTV